MIILVIYQKYQIQFGVRSVLDPDWKPVPDSQWQCFMNKSNLLVLLGNLKVLVEQYNQKES